MYGVGPDEGFSDIPWEVASATAEEAKPWTKPTWLDDSPDVSFKGSRKSAPPDPEDEWSERPIERPSWFLDRGGGDSSQPAAPPAPPAANSTQSPPSVNRTIRPSWLFNEEPPAPPAPRKAATAPQPSAPHVEYQPSVPNPAYEPPVPRQPMLARTFIPDYGYVEIAAPVLPKVTPAPPPPVAPPSSYYEYRVPRDLIPNPLYDPVHQPQPHLHSPPYHSQRPTFYRQPQFQRHTRGGHHPQSQYQHHMRGGMYGRRGGRRGMQFTRNPDRVPFTRAPGSQTETSTAPPPSEFEPEPINTDNFGSADDAPFDDTVPKSTEKWTPKSKVTRISMNEIPIPETPAQAAKKFPKSRELDLVKKRVTFALKESSKRKKPPETPAAQLKKKFEKEMGQMFRLGQKDKNVEPEPDPEPDTVPDASDGEEEINSSPPASTSSPPSDMALIKELLSKVKNNKEKKRLLNNQEELERMVEQTRKDIATGKRTSPVTTTKPTTSKTKKVNTRKSTVTNGKEGTSAGFSGESENDTGSVLSTNSGTGRQRNSQPRVPKATKSTGKRGRPRSGTTAKKSTNKGKTSSPPATKQRKRVVNRIYSSESDAEAKTGSTVTSGADDSSSTIHTSDDGRRRSGRSKSKLNKEEAIKRAAEQIRAENQRKLQSRSENQIIMDEEDLLARQHELFSFRESETGGIIHNRNDIFVHKTLNKINLGEEEEGIKLGELKVEKQEVDISTVKDEARDDDIQDPFMTYALSHVETQMEADTPDQQEISQHEVTESLAKIKTEMAEETGSENIGQEQLDNVGDKVQANDEAGNEDPIREDDEQEAENVDVETVTDAFAENMEIGDASALEGGVEEQDGDDDSFFVPCVLSVQGNYAPAPESNETDIQL